MRPTGLERTGVQRAARLLRVRPLPCEVPFSSSPGGGPVELELRPAREGDLLPVLQIYNHYVRATPITFEVTEVGVEERRAWFEEHSHGGRHRLVVAAPPDGAIVGWASTSTFRARAAYDTTVEASVYLDPGHLGRGVGSRLYEHLFRSIEGEDIERIVAGVTVPNPASERLHTSFGFQRVGTFTRVGRKFGRFWDVAWFERPLRMRAHAAGSTPANAGLSASE